MMHTHLLRLFSVRRSDRGIAGNTRSTHTAGVCPLAMSMAAATATIAIVTAPSVASAQRVTTYAAVSSSAYEPPAGQNSSANGLVTLALRDVPLRSALRAISQQSGVMLSYSERLVPVDRHVSIVVTRVTALDALHLVLHGTGIDVVVTSLGKMVLVPAADAHHAQAGDAVVIGLITDAATKRRLAGAKVSIPALKRATLSSDDGVYRLAVTPGTYQLTVQRLGYSVQSRRLILKSSDTVTADFALTEVVNHLQDIVTTGAGDRRRLEVGNSIATIDAASIVPTTPIRNLSDLLNGRAPGVQVTSTSGAVGSGSQIRIRGVSSIAEGSDPIVIVDGIRVDAGYSQPIPGAAPTNPTFGGTDPRSAAANQQTGLPASSRLNDIDPESIEKVEVLKGPSAATLYGSDAANGVIVITTKKGRPGPTRWTFFGQAGTSHMDATFPDAWLGWGTSDVNPSMQTCTLIQMGMGQCVQDSVTHYNPLNHKDTSPLGTGSTSKYGAQVSGGSGQLQYFLGADYDNEIGLEKLDPFDAERFLAQLNGASIPSWVQRPNTLNAFHLNSNFTAQLSPAANVALSSGYTHQYHRDDVGNQLMVSSLNSAGYRDSASGGWGGPLGSPEGAFISRSSDIIDRGNVGLTGNWQPTSFWSSHATLGGDYTDRADDGLLPSLFIDDGLGSRAHSDMNTLVRTLDAGTSLQVPVFPSLQSRSTLGLQYTRTDMNGVTVTAQGLASGSDVVNNATTRDGSEFHSASAVEGWYVEEALSLNSRAFLTAAVRGDASSSFGSNAKDVYYPKWSASWLVSDEPFFPKFDALSSLRLRGAYGHAGVQPTVDARFRSFKSSDGYVGGDAVPGIVITTVGNPNLRPERSTELEGGFDLGLWQDRVLWEFTLYRKLTRDALVPRTLPPSLGLPTRYENLGKVDNRGLELSATLRPVTTPFLDWTAILGFSKNRNRLVTLGTTTLPPIPNVFGSSQERYVEGYPLNGFWDRPILGYSDLNGDGLIESSEVRLGDSAVYRGQPFPKGELSVHNELSFFHGTFTMAGTFNYTDGLTQLDASLWGQCGNQRCQLMIDPTTSLANQAFVAVANTGNYGQGGSAWGFLETVSYLRFSELSLTLSMSPKIAQRLHARNMSVSVMGRNLGLWSNYRGADPEVNSNIFANQIFDDGGVPQPRDWSIRVNLGY